MPQRRALNILNIQFSIVILMMSCALESWHKKWYLCPSIVYIAYTWRAYSFIVVCDVLVLVLVHVLQNLVSIFSVCRRRCCCYYLHRLTFNCCKAYTSEIQLCRLFYCPISQPNTMTHTHTFSRLMNDGIFAVVLPFWRNRQNSKW